MSDPTRIQRPTSLPNLPDAATTARIGKQNERAARGTNAAGNPSFAELLRARQGLASGGVGTANDVRFSAHAQSRLESRQIALKAGHLDRLQGAVNRAAGKGAKDALVLMDDLAMVVSIPNRTVITVVDKENLKQNVFTNIDSAVIA